MLQSTNIYIDPYILTGNKTHNGHITDPLVWSKISGTKFRRFVRALSFKLITGIAEA